MDYSKLLIKEYNHWLVQIFDHQNYLGRCIVWCKREDATDFTEATKEELEELMLILKELKEATTRAFNADWFNYAFLGNETPHLHGHFIPRYRSEREFVGVIFKDELWGHKYQTDKSFVLTPEQLETIRLTLKEELG